jgi:hypothetical protein
MSFGGITGSGLATYVASMLNTAEQKANEGTAGTSTTKHVAGSSASALDTIAHSRKSVSAQATLTRQQTQLTSDIRTALTSRGLALKGELSFSTNSDGDVEITGSKDDRAAFATLIQNDTTKPSITQRLTGLVQSADKLSASMRDSAAWAQAARYAGRNGNMMELYSTFAQTQDSSASAYRVDATAGSLTYPGVISSKA